MPNPERLDKVELSMEHLEEVVRERNRAYWQLEVGVSGERERTYRKNFLGQMVPYKPREHCLPIWMNTSYRNSLKFRFQNSGREDVQDFKMRWMERQRWLEQKQELLQMRAVIIFFAIFFLKMQYTIHLCQGYKNLIYVIVLGCKSFEKISKV